MQEPMHRLQFLFQPMRSPIGFTTRALETDHSRLKAASFQHSIILHSALSLNTDQHQPLLLYSVGLCFAILNCLSFQVTPLSFPSRCPSFRYWVVVSCSSVACSSPAIGIIPPPPALKHQLFIMFKVCCIHPVPFIRGILPRMGQSIQSWPYPSIPQ